jgi:hypothetical protein
VLTVKQQISIIFILDLYYFNHGGAKKMIGSFFCLIKTHPVFRSFSLKKQKPAFLWLAFNYKRLIIIINFQFYEATILILFTTYY